MSVADTAHSVKKQPLGFRKRFVREKILALGQNNNRITYIIFYFKLKRFFCFGSNGFLWYRDFGSEHRNWARRTRKIYLDNRFRRFHRSNPRVRRITFAWINSSRFFYIEIHLARTDLKVRPYKGERLTKNWVCYNHPFFRFVKSK